MASEAYSRSADNGSSDLSCQLERVALHLSLFCFPFLALGFEMQRSLQETLNLGHSWAIVSHELTLMLHFLMLDLRTSLKRFFLPSPGTFTLTGFTEKNLLRESVVRHPDKVAGPTKLLADNHRLNAGCFCLRGS